MPASGPVYQPTTVTYDQQPSESRWHCPMSYFSQRITNEINRTRCLMWGTFLLGLIIVATGLKILIDGALGSSTAYLVVGILMLLVGVTLLGLFMHLVVRRSGVFGKGGGLGGEGGGGGGVGGTGALGAQANPSTDPLVGAQYAPVRDAPPGDDERRQLMDNKDCLSSAEESDRMLESDPRIVLRPLKNVEEA